MSRPLRIQVPEAVYHVSTPGNGDAAIVHDDDDRHGFVDLLWRSVATFELVLHGYCLLDAEYHLLVQAPLGNLSRAMQHLNGAHAHGVNGRHDRRGHLFGERYRSRVIESRWDLVATARALDLLGVSAGECTRPELQRWGSYRATVGDVPEPPLLTTTLILRTFSSDRARARQRYRAFVHDKLVEALERGKRRRLEAIPA